MAYKIVFAGTGIIGAGLAVNALLNDQEVRIYDVIDSEKALLNIKNVVDIMIRSGAAEEQDAYKKFAKIRFFGDLEEALEGGVDMVQECVPERVELKQSIYKTVQEKLGEDVLICSSTSMMMPSKLSEGMLYPQNIIVGHPYNPSYLLPLVELCGPQASVASMEKAKAIYTAMGKVPVVCKKEHTGFIANNMSWKVFYAAMDCLKEDICSAEDADKALVYGPGMRMAVLGQLLTISLGIPGGLAQAPAKYGVEADPLYDIAGKGVDEEMKNRPKEQGNTVEEIEVFRDKVLAGILKLHGLL